VRVRGLKYGTTNTDPGCRDVVPRAGTWIEIYCRRCCIIRGKVVPRAGTWIEIFILLYIIFCNMGRTPCGYVD